MDNLLQLCKEEFDRAIGLDQDDELTPAREKALQYAQGVMNDVPSLPNRSRAVSTDVADAIETVLPDLMEIFTGGDDVASFAPQGPEDEAGAAQETDYINHVVFNENDGFGSLYTAFKDALLVKTGVFTFWWDEDEYAEETLEVDAVQMQMLAESGYEIAKADVVEGSDPEQPRFSVTIRKVEKAGCAKFKAVPPEDFAVAPDTVALRDATYCVMRSRPRAQDLIADGYERAKVDDLPGCVETGEAVSQARDTASETEDQRDAATNDLRRVEILQHCIKVLEGDKLVRYSVVTDRDCTVLLEKTKINRVCFAALTPYLVAHRFYGESLADKLLEIQRIKTALVRMLLDSGYFALNQRVEVSEDQASKNTIADLLRNEPGVPVRSKTGNAIKPISAGALSFDVQGALEYVSTMAEQRTGIVRNAQGLNPDTLHDTAKGAQTLMTQAMKRIRMIARIFAETGLKDLFLGLHELTRTHSTQAQKVRLRNQWVQVDPTNWGNRADMTIEIGVGAGGREQEMLALQGVIGLQQQLMASGTGMVQPANLYAASKKFIERSGLKSAEPYITDPAQVPPQEPPPDPKMIEMQGKMQIEQQKLQLEEQKMQADIQLEREKAEAEVQLAREKMQMEFQMATARNALQMSQGNVRFGGQVG